MTTTTVIEIEMLRTELFTLCEHMEERGYGPPLPDPLPANFPKDTAGYSRGFEAGYRKAAKSIRNAMGDVFREALERHRV